LANEKDERQKKGAAVMGCKLEGGVFGEVKEKGDYPWVRKTGHMRTSSTTVGGYWAMRLVPLIFKRSAKDVDLGRL